MEGNRKRRCCCDNQTCPFRIQDKQENAECDSNPSWNDAVPTCSKSIGNHSKTLHSGTMQNIKRSRIQNNFAPFDDDEAQQVMKINKDHYLIEDTYDPGLIEESVECRKDFNAISFGLFFENMRSIPKELPSKTPMSLIEAFHRRIGMERNFLLRQKNSNNSKGTTTTNSVDNYFSNKPKTKLNEALKNLYKAEALHEAEKMRSKETAEDRPYEVHLQHIEAGGVMGEFFFGQTKPVKSKKKCT